MKAEWDADEARARELGLEGDELTFFDAVAENHGNLYDEPFLRDLIHDVVQSIKRNLKVDWTEPHRDDVKAGILAAVRRVLRRRKVKAEDLDGLVERVMEQAVTLFGDWPRAA